MPAAYCGVKDAVPSVGRGRVPRVFGDPLKCRRQIALVGRIALTEEQRAELKLNDVTIPHIINMTGNYCGARNPPRRRQFAAKADCLAWGRMRRFGLIDARDKKYNEGTPPVNADANRVPPRAGNSLKNKALNINYASALNKGLPKTPPPTSPKKPNAVASAAGPSGRVTGTKRNTHNDANMNRSPSSFTNNGLPTEYPHPVTMSMERIIDKLVLKTPSLIFTDIKIVYRKDSTDRKPLTRKIHMDAYDGLDMTRAQLTYMVLPHTIGAPKPIRSKYMPGQKYGWMNDKLLHAYTLLLQKHVMDRRMRTAFIVSCHAVRHIPGIDKEGRPIRGTDANGKQLKPFAFQKDKGSGKFPRQIVSSFPRRIREELENVFDSQGNLTYDTICAPASFDNTHWALFALKMNRNGSYVLQ
eukprot:810278-Pleurochrysis_carterae.AAC.1